MPLLGYYFTSYHFDNLIFNECYTVHAARDPADEWNFYGGSARRRCLGNHTLRHAEIYVFLLI